MKKLAIFTSILFAIATNVRAQVADGFYRVQNYGSQRYAYVCDNTGSINVQTTSADMGAIALYNPSARNRLIDPASIIYASKKGQKGNLGLYDLESQGTGVHEIINYYVGITQGTASGTYWVYEPTYSMYLWDDTRSKLYEKSHIGTDPVKDANGKVINDYRCWKVIPVTTTGDEYLGILPDSRLLCGGYYYKPYYIDFAINFVNSNTKAYYVSEIKQDAVIIEEVVGTIPAATPIIVKCNTLDASANRVELKATSPTSIKNNKLTGNYFCYSSHGTSAYKIYNAETMRLLAVKDGKLQYITDTQHEYCTELEFSKGTKVTYEYCVPANESYLVVPKGTAASLPVMTRAEYEAAHAALQGDVNKDGKVDIADVAIVYKQIGAGVSASAAPSSDVDKNGKIDIADVAVIYKNISSGK